MTSLATFDDLIASRSLLKHPFYVRWSKGELTLEDLKIYAKEYYALVVRVPWIVSRVRDHALMHGDEVLAARIGRNVTEEQEHIALWERFAASLGISLSALQSHQPSAAMRSAVATLEEIASGSLEEGVAAVYALERELADIARTKKEGLLRFYGLDSTDAHAYFDEHLGEEAHLQVWRAVPVGATVERAVRASMDAQNKALDGVCEACGIPLHC